MLRDAPVRRPRAFAAALVLLGASGVAACSATNLSYGTRPRFTPRLSEAELAAPGQLEPTVRVLATVKGLRRAEDDSPRTLDVRLRYENRASSPVRVTPSRLVLLAADLRELGPPSVEAGGAFTPSGDGSGTTYVLAEGGSGVLTARFPVPEAERGQDAPDLSALNLRVAVTFEDGTVERSLTFERDEERELGPVLHYYPVYPFGHPLYWSVGGWRY